MGFGPSLTARKS